MLAYLLRYPWQSATAALALALVICTTSSALYIKATRSASQLQLSNAALRAEQLKTTLATEAAQASETARIKQTNMQRRVDDAEQAQAATMAEIGRLQRDYAATQRLLNQDAVDVRVVVPKLTRPAVDDYAVTCSAVFAELAAAGAELAAEADGQAADKAALMAGWPEATP